MSKQFSNLVFSISVDTTSTKKSFSIYDLANGKPGRKISIAKFLDFYKNSKKRKVSNDKGKYYSTIRLSESI